MDDLLIDLDEFKNSLLSNYKEKALKYAFEKDEIKSFDLICFDYLYKEGYQKMIKKISDYYHSKTIPNNELMFLRRYIADFLEYIVSKCKNHS